jgi:hypothetical protein
MTTLEQWRVCKMHHVDAGRPVTAWVGLTEDGDRRRKVTQMRPRVIHVDDRVRVVVPRYTSYFPLAASILYAASCCSIPGVCAR